MALEMNDIMMLRGMEKEGFSPYEQVKINNMQNRNHTSGIGVAGLVLGTVGTAVGVGAWLFGGMYSNAKSNQAREAAIAAEKVANVQIQASQRQIDQLTNLLAVERTERLQGQTTISQTITDSISGQQSSSLTAMQQSELSAVANASNTLLTQSLLGNVSENPQKVMLYSAPQPCNCPGCGCNG